MPIAGAGDSSENFPRFFRRQFTRCGEFQDQHRKHQEDQHGREQHAADDHERERPLDLRADAGRERRRNQADAGDDASHDDGPQLCAAGLQHGGRTVEARFQTEIVVGQHENPVHGRNAEQRDESDRRGDAERRRGDPQREYASEHRHGDHAGREQRIAQISEFQIQQQHDQRDRQRHDDAEARNRLLQIAEFPDPFQVITAGYQHLRIHGTLRLEHRAAEIPSPHAELDGYVALLLFAVDEGRAGDEVHVRDVLERHLDQTAAVGGVRADRNMLDRFEVLPEWRRQAHHHREMPVAAALVEVAGTLAADRGLNDRVDVARSEAVAGGALAIDVDAYRRLSERTQDREIHDARNLGERRGDADRGLLERLEIIAVDLHRVLALDAGGRFFDVVLDVLRKIEIDAWKLLAEVVGHGFRERLFVDALGPAVERLQRHEEFGVEKAGRVGAVIGAAVLRDHGLDLGIAFHDLAHAIDIEVAVLERYRLRKRRADPQIALLELRKKLEAQRAHRDERQQTDQRDSGKRHDAIREHELERRLVDTPQPAHDRRFALCNIRRKKHEAQGGRDRKRRDQTAGDRIGVGLRHRSKDMPLDSGQREQRHEARDDDRGREEDRLADLGGADRYRSHLAAEAARRPHSVQNAGPDAEVRRIFREMAKDIFDHDHGGVDDETEIDGADRQQVRGFAAQYHEPDRERERKWNRQRNDHGAA